VGQVKWATPRSKNETEQWLKDATLFYRTIEQSYQLNLRLEFDLNVRLLPLVPSSPPPLPPFPAKSDWPIRRLLNETSAASSPPPPPTPPPSPSPPPWHSDDEACAASHFPVLYDREPVLRARALSGNGKVSPNVWLNVMQSFYHGLQELRTMHVPLDCVPPAFRDQAAAEAVAQTIMETPPSNTSAGRKLLQSLAFDAGVLAELVQSALDARQLAVLDHQQALLKDLFVTAQRSLFGTASACARRPVLSSHLDLISILLSLRGCCRTVLRDRSQPEQPHTAFLPSPYSAFAVSTECSVHRRSRGLVEECAATLGAIYQC